MKNLILAAFIILTFITSAYAQNSDSLHQVNNGNLIVRIKGISDDEGKIMIALNNSPENYRAGAPFRGLAGKISNGMSEVIIENIPFGEYAIKGFHDQNSNGELDSNMLGIPTEGYCFSNNARGNYGPALYKDAKFTFSVNNQVVELNID